MSLRTPFYGGFPGPPAQSGSTSNDSQGRGSSSSRQRQYDVPQGSNSNYVGHSIGPSYPGQHAPGFASNPMGYPYNGGQFMPNLYYNPGQEFHPRQEYFTQGYPDQFHPMHHQQHPFSPPGIPFYPDAMSSSFPDDGRSQEGLGKPRRFSKQRTNKDSNAPGSSGEITSHSQDRPDSKTVLGKTAIRFSHQKEDTNSNSKKESKTKVKMQSRLSEAENSENGTPKATNSKQPPAKDKNERMHRQKKKKTPNVDGNQASVLLDQLSAGTYECMVCCDRIKQFHAVWSCSKCFHLFHMVCIKKWARSPVAKVNETETGWRCPGCQNVTKQVPNTYYCFCGKVRDPEWKKGEIPHSCGENCNKQRKDYPGCTHPCNILCHPGPCPQCPAMVKRQCKCGKITTQVRCSQQSSLRCELVCGKFRNCGIHDCLEICHPGKCEDCDKKVTQECFCGKHTREVICGSEEHKSSLGSEETGCYSCEEICNKSLECENHHCEALCHPGKCSDCALLPCLVKLCPCSQTKLEDMKNEDGSSVQRKNCLDPVPTCGKICNKPLECGGDEIHICTLPCHVGSCPPCAEGESTIKCRCGKSEKDVPCVEYVTMDTYICDRRCNKKRKCGRHKCGQTCCMETEHSCMQICGRKLTCGNHRCDEPCHRGSCHTCYNVSFDELHCYCGDKVTYPPIPCGTKAPECNNECTRMHPCTHPIRHTCHTEENCPPCVELVKKKCNCGRVVRGNIMCHVDNVSCGTPCEKILSCGHKCSRPCHKGQCGEEGSDCKQPCSIMRSECIHPCATPCHHGNPCPATSCRAMVTLKCPCGRREEQVECSSGGETYQGMRNAAMAGAKSSEGIDIGTLLMRSGSAASRRLQCNEECSIVERNRRLAAALNVKDADLSSKTKQEYSDFLKFVAKSDGPFIRTLEKELCDLIDSVDWMSSSKQVHSFPNMKRDKRQAVHELAEAFVCKSESHDEEPNRNVVVTATKGVSRRPTPLLSALVLEQAAAAPKTFPATKTASSKGRLLSSMKFVSYKSDSTSRDPGPKRVQTQMRKATEASSSMAYKPPSMRVASNAPQLSTRFDVLSLSSPTTHSQQSSSASKLSPTAKAFVRTGQHSSTSTATNQSSETKETGIDYFDMTD
uniref:NF-X-like Transcriptional repressor n=1 Tax=Phallusia mammillata TaxID=59560 RepID=A0A6F9DMW1_9ASCI|nr:NF-X-like Transcriptional repressor [Phallusia mammillata]